MRQVTFTQFESNKSTLSKIFSREGGEIIKKPAAQMCRGTAVQKSMPFGEFKDFLSSLTSEQAIGFGVHDVERYGGEVEISTKANARPEEGVLARSKEYFQYLSKPGIMMLDHDPSRYGKTFTPEQLLDVLSEIAPDLAQSSHLIRGSVSSGVHLQGQSPGKGKGFHIYLPVKNAADIPRAGKALFNRLWLQGHGFVTLSTCGSSMIRGPIDAAVFSPERLDFAGKPVIASDGLSYSPPQAIWQDGDAVDTSRIHDLDPHETTELDRLQTGAKALMKDLADEVRAAWELEHRAELEKRGVEPDDIEKVFSRIGEERSDLYPDWLLVFSDGRSVTVGDILQNPQDFDKCSLADPLEGPGYGSTTATFFWNKGVKPVIYSFAHGGHVFSLKRTYAFDPERFIYLKEEDRYFDTTDRSLIRGTALNNMHLATNPGVKGKPPTARTVFHSSVHADDQTVRGQYWQPTDPQKPVKHIIEVDGALYLNSWQGIRMEPESGDIDPWLDLTAYLIPDEKEREAVLSWMAFNVQKPHIKPNWQIVHLGTHRNGKDSLYKPFIDIFQEAASEILAGDMSSAYNGYLSGKKMLLINELWAPDDRAFVNKLKVLAASTAGGNMLINPKYGVQHWQANALGFVAMSNRKNCLAVDPGEGRYFVLESWVDPKPKEYYQAYYAWLEHGGSQRVLDFLLNRDLAGFSGQILPFKTHGFLNLCERAKRDYAQFLEELIDQEEFPFSRPVVTLDEVRRILFLNNYRPGRNGITETLNSVGFKLYSNNSRKKNGKVVKAPNFWTRENPGKTARERYDFYFAITDPDGRLARMREIQDSVKANQVPL
jgi:hypothetical protein